MNINIRNNILFNMENLSIKISELIYRLELVTNRENKAEEKHTRYELTLLSETIYFKNIEIIEE